MGWQSVFYKDFSRCTGDFGECRCEQGTGVTCGYSASVPSEPYDDTVEFNSDIIVPSIIYSNKWRLTVNGHSEGHFDKTFGSPVECLAVEVKLCVLFYDSDGNQINFIDGSSEICTTVFAETECDDGSSSQDWNVRVEADENGNVSIYYNGKQKDSKVLERPPVAFRLKARIHCFTGGILSQEASPQLLTFDCQQKNIIKEVKLENYAEDLNLPGGELQDVVAGMMSMFMFMMFFMMLFSLISALA